MHPSWRGFNLHYLRPEGPMLWSAELDDVPVGRLRLRVSDANACRNNPTGAVTDQVVYANDVRLTERVNTPGTGTEPGFAFYVDEAGAVSP